MRGRAPDGRRPLDDGLSKSIRLLLSFYTEMGPQNITGESKLNQVRLELCLCLITLSFNVDLGYTEHASYYDTLADLHRCQLICLLYRDGLKGGP